MFLLCITISHYYELFCINTKITKQKCASINYERWTKKLQK